MKNPESPREENRLEQLIEVINNSRQAIEKEFAETANDWLSCFGTRVFIIETYLFSPKTKELLPPEKYEAAVEKLEKLKERHFGLKQQYQTGEKIEPPDEIKEALLSQLDVLKDE